MKTIFKKNLTKETTVAVVKARDWYAHHINMHYPIMPEDFVVCKWFDFHDGKESNIEGKQTIAVCREESHAKLIFKSLCEKRK